MVKLVLSFIAIFILTFQGNGQSLYFPPLTGDGWETTFPSELNWDTSKLDELITFLDDENTRAFLILKDGKIVVEHYFGDFDRDKAWYWASAGKSLTAFAVGLVQQKGLLSIQEPSANYLGTGWAAITPEQEQNIKIVHHLSMTTGLDDGVPDSDCTIDTCLLFLAEPGTRWAYHNAPYTILDRVISGASGQNLNIFLNQNLFNQTGMSGVFLPAGSNNVFWSKPRSMARFGLLTLNNGNWDGNQIMTDTTFFKQMTTRSQELNKSYGYLWWLNGQETYRLPGLQFDFPGPLLPNAPDNMIAALGLNGQIINVVPTSNLVIVRMGDSPSSGNIGALLNNDIWSYLNEIIPPSNSTTQLKTADEEPKVYPNPSESEFNIQWKDKMFSAQLFHPNGQLIHSYPESFSNQLLALKHLNHGVYFLHLKAVLGEQKILRIVKR